ncbi:hypothetical protein [Neomegalonema sp.]|uniref:hypothetical protein n=1 Tax=Neomegalonema sp. TaxID=2039713 RepID=UPI00263543A1|nr:hypothetical protein [Neomegalonema sp.]MDD2867476.1 hypothetical protein [Neomegalonema sp.]
MDYFAIEYLAYWEGRLSAGRLAALLGKTRSQVQRTIIKDYEEQHPGALMRGGRGKTFADTAEGLKFAPTSASALLDVIRGERRLAESSGEKPRFGPPLEEVSAFGFSEPDPDVFQRLYAACVGRRAVRLDYAAKSGLMECDFSPHALVRDGGRIHFRGYASTIYRPSTPYPDPFRQYIDLVPSRVRRLIHESSVTDYVPDAGDADWHARETLVFRLNDDLPKEILGVLAVEHEGARASGDFRIKRIQNVRKALRIYVQRSLRHRAFGDVLYEIWRPVPN